MAEFEYDWPPTPDLVPGVLARIGSPRRRGRAILAVALALLVPAAGALAIPGVRRWLGLEHVVVKHSDAPPPARAIPPERGTRVTLAEAGRRAGFAPYVPPVLGRPREVRERNGVVSLLYGRVKVSEVRGSFDRQILLKTLNSASRVRRIPHGFYLTGRHFYAYLDEFGNAVGRQTAGRTLVVERRGLVLRLEGASLVEARRLLGV
jgi:hypothetical protein